MLPFLAKIGSVLIPTMPVFWCLGYLTGAFIVIGLSRRQGLDMSKILNLLIFTIAASVMGARISAVFLLAKPEQLRWFLDHPAEIFKFWKSGYSFYGVVFFSLAAGTWYCFRSGLPVPFTAELFIPGVALGHFIQSIGDFLAGAHPGIPTTLPWGIMTDNPLFRGPKGVLLHPVMLYIAALSAVGFLTAYGWLQVREGRKKFLFSFAINPAFRLLRLRFIPGEMFFLSGAFYALFRFFVEFFRDPRTLIWYPDFPLPQTQAACIGFFILCWGVYFGLRVFREDEEAGREQRRWVKAGMRFVAGIEWLAKRIPYKEK